MPTVKSIASGKAVMPALLIVLMFVAIGFGFMYPATGLPIFSGIQSGSTNFHGGCLNTCTPFSLASTPVDGNTLFMTITVDNGQTVQSVTEQGATWQKQIGYLQQYPLGGADSEIWAAFNVKSASPIISIVLSNIADTDFWIAEFNGMQGSMDTSASAFGSSANNPFTMASGITGNLANSNEVVIASLGATATSTLGYSCFATQPTNGFVSLGNGNCATHNGVLYSNEFVYKIADNKNTISTGDSFGAISAPTYWTGVIAAFPSTTVAAGGIMGGGPVTIPTQPIRFMGLYLVQWIIIAFGILLGALGVVMLASRGKR